MWNYDKSMYTIMGRIYALFRRHQFHHFGHEIGKLILEIFKNVNILYSSNLVWNTALLFYVPVYIQGLYKSDLTKGIAIFRQNSIGSEVFEAQNYI